MYWLISVWILCFHMFYYVENFVLSCVIGEFRGIVHRDDTIYLDVEDHTEGSIYRRFGIARYLVWDEVLGYSPYMGG